jgi:hypothetical protein
MSLLMPADGTDWADAFGGRYRQASYQNQERRARRRARRRQPASKAIAAGDAEVAAAWARIEHRFAEAQRKPDFTAPLWQFIRSHAAAGNPDAKLVWRADCEPLFAERRQERLAEQRALVRQRMDEGFRWAGGLVGGNPDYVRAPFVYPGLVSERHPLYRLFVASTPRAARLRTGDTKAVVDRVGQKLLALDSPYVDASKSLRRVLRVEVDRGFAGGVAELAVAIAACGVCLPNFVVGHVDRAGRLLNPHLIWLIGDSVVFTHKGKTAPQALWKAVLRGLTARLLPVGADPGGLANPLRVKNPLSPLWHCSLLAEEPYTLAPDTRAGAPGLMALTPGLDLNGALAVLQDAATARRGRLPVADHPDPAVVSQSNAIFRHLSGVARDRIGWYRDQGNGIQDAFLQELLAEVRRIVPSGHAAEQQAVATAKSVARWTWDHFRPRTRCSTPEERQVRQAAGQAKGAATKRDVTLSVLVEVACRLIEDGKRPTQVAVAAAAGRSAGTARHHWPAILDALHQRHPEAPAAGGGLRLRSNGRIPAILADPPAVKPPAFVPRT